MLWNLRQTTLNQARDPRRQVGPSGGDRFRLVPQRRGQCFHRRFTVKRWNSAGHLIKNRAEGEEIRAGVGVLAGQRLGRGIACRTDDEATLGESLERHYGGSGIAIGLADPRQTEVKNLRRSLARDEDVFRLEIAMHDATLMSGGERISDLSGEAQDQVG